MFFTSIWPAMRMIILSTTKRTLPLGPKEDGEVGLRRCSGDARVSGELLRALKPF